MKITQFFFFASFIMLFSKTTLSQKEASFCINGCSKDLDNFNCYGFQDLSFNYVDENESSLDYDIYVVSVKMFKKEDQTMYSWVYELQKPAFKSLITKDGNKIVFPLILKGEQINYKFNEPNTASYLARNRMAYTLNNKLLGSRTIRVTISGGSISGYTKYWDGYNEVQKPTYSYNIIAQSSKVKLTNDSKISFTETNKEVPLDPECK